MDRAAESREMFHRRNAHRGAIEERAPAAFAAEIEILCDGHLSGEQKLLVDQDDAVVFSIGRPVEMDRRAVEQNAALVGLLMAAEQLRQRRFAGAVFADDGVDFAGMKGEREVDQDRSGAEGFAEGFGRKDRIRNVGWLTGAQRDRGVFNRQLVFPLPKPGTIQYET
jgi:hypothetical protein